MSGYQPLLNADNYGPDYNSYSNSNDASTIPHIQDHIRPAVEKSLLRKLDLRVAFLVLIYIMNYMDRNNVAAARLGGFEEDLNMTGYQFNTLISVLYVGYVIMQAPSNIFLDRMKRPSIYLSTCMAIWGAITLLTGTSQTYHTVLILRFLLGFVEAAFFPGAVFLLSRWYKRDELALRTALLTCGSSVSNAFSTLIASGILASLDGTLGFTAWRWLFFVEGFFTIVVAVLAIWILPDFPSTPSIWLSPDEQALAKQRMEEDIIADNEHQDKSAEETSGLAEALVDWKVWWLGITLCLMVAALSFGNFFPTLSATMGYNATISLVLCAPPWILGTVTSFFVARHSDTTGDRFWHIVGPLLVGIVGFTIAISTMNTTIRYLSLFFMTQASVGYVILLTWILNTFSQSQSKRAAAIALIISTATFGNAGSSYFWPSSWGPSYVNSYLMCISTSVTCIAMCWAFRQHLSRCNQTAEAQELALGLPKGIRYLL